MPFVGGYHYRDREIYDTGVTRGYGESIDRETQISKK